jgi:hypothetical protein
LWANNNDLVLTRWVTKTKTNKYIGSIFICYKKKIKIKINKKVGGTGCIPLDLHALHMMK